MGDRLQMLKDMGMNLYGLGENVAALGSAAGIAAYLYNQQNKDKQ